MEAPTQIPEWTALLRRGDAQAKSGFLDRAVDAYLDALDALYDIGQGNSRDAIRLHIRAGDMHVQLRNSGGALQHYLKVLRTLDKQDRLETAEHAGLLAKIANARMKAGNAKSALANLKEARRIMQDNDLLGTTNGARVLRSLGNAIASQKDAVEHDFEEAVRLLDISYDIFRSESLLESDEGIGLMTDLGEAQAKLKLYDSAVVSYTAAREALEATGSLQTPRGAALLAATGDALRSRLLQDRALAAYEEASNIYRECGQLNTQEGAILMSKIGKLYMQQYDREESVAACELAERIFEAIGELHTMEAGKLMLERGMQLAEDGDTIGAVKKLWVAREAFEANRLIGTTEGATLLETLGDMRTRQGQYKAAWKLYKKAEAVLKTLGGKVDLFSETPEGERLSLKITTVFQEVEKIAPMKSKRKKEEPKEPVTKMKWWARRKLGLSTKQAAAYEKRGIMDPAAAHRNTLLRGLPVPVGTKGGRKEEEWKRPQKAFNKPFDIINK